MSRFVISGNNSSASRFVKKTAANTFVKGKAKSQGLDLEALAVENNVALPPKKKKLSFLQRLGAGLGAFETGNAVATGIKQRSFAKGVGSYVTGIGKGLASAVTGRDFGQSDKKSYRDILAEQGIDNIVLKNGIGFIGDVLLDPTTYFGGAIAKGVTKGAKAVGDVGLKGVGKVAPDTEKGLRLAGKGVKDAFGQAFKFGYGTSKGVATKALEIKGKLDKAQEGLLRSNTERLGTGTLSPSQREDMVSTMLAGKRAQLTSRRIASSLETQLRNKELTILEKRLVQTQRYLGIKPKLENIPGISTVTAAKLRSSGFDILSLANAGTTGRFVEDVFVSNTERLAKVLNIKIEEASSLIDKAIKHVNDIAAVKPDLATRLDDISRQINEVTFRPFPKGVGADVAREFATTSDDIVQTAIEQQATRGQKFAKAAGVEDPYEIYYPGLRADKLQRFFEGTKPFKVGVEGYRKEFKNLLKDEELIRDPAEAFATREFQIVKDNIVRDELESMVRQYGKSLDEFKSADDALKEGFVVVKEKGMFGKEIGYLSAADKKFLDEFLGFSNQFAAIDAIAKATGFDAVTSLFKRAVTGLFAPFHVRNYVSGLIQNYEVLGPRALSPSTIALGQRAALKIARNQSFGDETINLNGKLYSLNKVLEPFVKRFQTSSQYISDFQEATIIGSKLFSKQAFKDTLKTGGLGAKSIPFRTARAIGNFVETQQKAVAYFAALKSGRNVRQALDYAARAGFDYRALTSLESKVFRRIIPFYSFTRKNIELQLQTLGENPQRIATIIKAAEALQGDIDKEQLDDYTKDQFVLKVGEKKPGVPEVATGLGTALENFTTLLGKNPIQRIAATLNPVFKVPLERAFNRDFFRDRPLEGENAVIEAGEYARAPKYVKDFLQVKEVKSKDKDGNDKIKYQANPYRLQLLRNLPTARGATYVSAIFNEDASAVSRILNSLTGIKPRPVDLETVEYFKNLKNQQELEDLLIQAGVLKRFEKAYIPKE